MAYKSSLKHLKDSLEDSLQADRTQSAYMFYMCFVSERKSKCFALRLKKKIKKKNIIIFIHPQISEKITKTPRKKNQTKRIQKIILTSLQKPKIITYNESNPQNVSLHIDE